MKVIKEYSNSQLVFDNTESKSSKTKIDVGSEVIQVDYNSIVDTQFSGGNTGQDFEALKTYLNLGMYSKSPCGGFVNFYLQEGSKGGKYIIFSGINEASNSHYIVTIHKILQK